MKRAAFSPDRAAARLAIACALLGPLYLAPLFATRFLPALDLPHHVAIADALLKSGAPDSPYATFFVVKAHGAPFAAHFVALQALGAWMPLADAARLLVALQVLLLPVACARLLSACGRSTLPALLAFPLGYAMPLHYGLIAFVLAVPVMVWALAEAADEAAFTRRPRAQTGLLAVALAALFYFHLEAWAVALCAAIATVATHRLPLARRALGLAAAVPSLIALFFYGTRVGAGGGAEVGALGRAFVAETAREWAENGALGHLASRARGLPVHLLRGFTDGADVRASYGFFALVLGLAALAWAAPAAGPRPAPRRFGAAGCLGLVALAAYAALPHHFHPHAHSIYPRFAVVLAVAALLLVPARLSRAGPRLLDVTAAVLTLVMAGHAWLLVREYRAFGRETADFAALLQAVPAGHAAAGLVFDARSRVMNVENMLSGLPAYYVTERPSPRSWTWLYYCQQPHLPCQLREPGAPPAVPHFTRPEELDPRRALEHVDLFLVRGGPPAEAIFGAEAPRLERIAESGTWRAFLRR